MRARMSWLMVVAFAWILWMDQSVYTLSRESRLSGAEGATGKWVQLAVVPNKQACEALRRDRVRDAAPRDEAALRDALKHRRGHYPEKHRFFCSPAVDDRRK